MKNNSMPWKDIIQFHRDIAVRSEESFFSFNIADNKSERFSFVGHGVVNHMLVQDMIKPESLLNQQILLAMDTKNTEFYVGGIFWFTNKKEYNGDWVKYAHPLFYKQFSVDKYSPEAYKLEPEQARWNISPMFYQLLDKKGIIIEGDSEEMIQELAEDADKSCGEGSFEDTFISLFIGKFPELKKEFIINAPKQAVANWVAFTAPKDYSAIMRMLILDYAKLMKKLAADPDNYGGLSIFEETKVHKMEKIPVMPIVPLNESQLEVVGKVIAGNPVTVVTGPPGCGKSQVVLSILLNAWEKGQSVLFASSNNQAVDVVRNRMRPFEHAVDVPLVVRCGSRKMSEIVETFQKMMATIDDVQETKLAIKSDDEINRINADIEELNKLLDSNLPQRIDEQSRTALGAYGKAGEYRERIVGEIDKYNDRVKELGVKGDISSFEDEIYQPLIRWDLQHDDLLNDLRAAEDKRTELVQKTEDIQSKIVELPFKQINNRFTGRVRPRNIQQQLAIDMLYNQDITVKVLVGKFGTGKDYLMSSAGIDLVEKGKFERIVWVRNNIEVKNSKPIGYLPGTNKDKLLPFAMPLADHLGGVDGLEIMIGQGKIELVHLGFIRGRDIKNSIIMCSEAENMTKEHIQLLLGRVGEGSALWINGDYKQVDSDVFRENSGLMSAVDKLKGHSRFGFVKLIKTERSETAAMADLLD